MVAVWGGAVVAYWLESLFLQAGTSRFWPHVILAAILFVGPCRDGLGLQPVKRHGNAPLVPSHAVISFYPICPEYADGDRERRVFCRESPAARAPMIQACRADGPFANILTMAPDGKDPAAPMLGAHAAPVQLWELRGKRCLITPPWAVRPFVVEIYVTDKLLSREEFDTHNAAAKAAVAALKKA